MPEQTHENFLRGIRKRRLIGISILGGLVLVMSIFIGLCNRPSQQELKPESEVDLALSNLALSANWLCKNRPLQIAFDLQNNGGTDAGPFTIKLFLDSQNAVPDTAINEADGMAAGGNKFYILEGSFKKKKLYNSRVEVVHPGDMEQENNSVSFQNEIKKCNPEFKKTILIQNETRVAKKYQIKYKLENGDTVKESFIVGPNESLNFKGVENYEIKSMNQEKKYKKIRLKPIPVSKP
ncbi:MAG: hypothetical protein AAFY71_09835 [Bacteroidota bacterium]